MAVGFCSGGGSDQDDLTSPGRGADVSHDRGHESHGHGDGGCSEKAACPDGGDCCDDKACWDNKDSSSGRSATLSCCNPSEEHCDGRYLMSALFRALRLTLFTEKCIMAAAALECEQTCEGDAAAHNGTYSKSAAR